MLNVGGKRFITAMSTLKSVEQTKLSTLSQSDPSFDSVRNEYFFDRNPKFFESILDYFRTGELHFSHCLCGPSIKKELSFWQIPETCISRCCWRAYKAYEDEKHMLQVSNSL